MRLPPFLVSLFRALGSLRLTVFLLAASVILVFFGTLDQVKIGIRAAQEIYFESLLAFWHYPETWPMGKALSWIPVPVPGGYLVGPLLAINLVFSHIRHFKFKWRLLGISVIHIGVLMLLVGQLMTNLLQKEDYMWLDEGAKANFVRSFHQDELYVNRHKPDGTMGVFSYPYEDLREGQVIRPAQFPFELHVKRVFVNAAIQSGGSVEGRSREGVTRGLGAQFNLGVQDRESFHSDDQRDVRSAVVEVVQDGESAGTWLVSNVFEERFPEQEFSLGNEHYDIGLRYKKTYLPFTMTLLEFNHDRYPGTNIPRNFSSKVRVEHAQTDESQEVMIFMNNPLRYEGFTFYQASFAKQDTASMFQVVRNPGWLMPYIACTLVSIGLLYQFGWVAYRSIRRTKS
jgi:hypothetical protein